MTEFLSLIEMRLSAIFQSNTLLNQVGAHLCLTSHAKRVRPLLVSYFADILKISASEIIPIALATELIHSASLLHDDVIDNAESRRGKPSVNAQWSNSVAVLSGNYLLSLAFEQLQSFPSTLTQEAISTVSQMTQAAILELQMRNRLDYTLDNWRSMVIGKTGSLFAFCGTSVAILDRNPEAYQAFQKSGYHIGQAFQLADDLHDLREDTDNLEASYPRLLSFSGNPEPQQVCQKELKEQVQKALHILEPWKPSTGFQHIQNWLSELICFDGCF